MDEEGRPRGVAALWVVVPNRYDLVAVLPQVASFLDAQKAGVPPSALQPASRSAYPWLQVRAAAGDPVPGGYFMAGSDYVKHSFPTAWAVALLAWQLTAFPRGFEAAGQTAAVQAHLRHGADYLMAAHPSPDTFVVQVGDPADYASSPFAAAAASWGRPSDMPPNRNTTAVTAASPGGADAAAGAAAGLAAAAAALARVDAAWAAGARAKAESLYRLASAIGPQASANGSYCSVAPCFEGMPSGSFRWRAFPSDSVFDDMAWAGAWLHRATGQRSYLADAEYLFALHLREEADLAAPGYYVPNYNKVAWGAQMSGKNDYGDVLLMTGRGLAYLPADATGGAGGGAGEPLPHAAGAALMALLYAGHAADGGGRGVSEAARLRLECFALGQVSYILGGQAGRNPSFVVGAGPRAPRAPAHAAASCPAAAAAPCTAATALLSPEITTQPNPNEIIGALVAGPGPDHGYADSRLSPGSRVGVHYNVPLLGAIAGLVHFGVDPGRCQGGGGFLQGLLPSDQLL
ncbi:MAG: Six-hairpin glycosidase-like protein [Monoraphidium minutum]|nr:MAG: Six-hairpin glycosidase-like protein [Monoraphidium minutum]